MRKVVVALLFMGLALAGCTGDNETPEDGQTADENSMEEEPGEGNSTEQGLAPAVNAAPSMMLTSDTTTGEAPLEVTFTINGSDDDNDPIEWSFDADGDGTAEAEGSELPAEVTFTYDAGTYEATLTGTDNLDTATATISIEATEPTVGPAPPEEEAEAEPECIDISAWACKDPVTGMCHATGGTIIPVGPLWVQDRGETPATGYALGDGTWLYSESNGVDGLQLGGADEQGLYQDCANPDSLIF